MVNIRQERDADQTRIRRVVAAAFGSDAEADLVDRIRASLEYVADMALVAEIDGDIVGHVMISGAVVRNDAGEHRVAMLSPLAVDPDHQGRGIGGSLVSAALAIADSLGEPFVLVEGDPGYYSRLGFEPAGDLGLRMPLPDWAPPTAAQICRLSSFDVQDARLGGAVIYPPAFDGLE